MRGIEGDGDDRRCIVTAVLRETGETLEYISPVFSKIQPKNSPLWKTKPDLQLYYNTSRDFCRAYFPDVLLGVYSAEELRDHVGPDNAKDVNSRPSVGGRLKGNKGRGFNASHVERETRGVVEETPAPGGASQQTEPREQESKPPVVETVTTPVEVAQVDQAGEMPATDFNSSQPPPETDKPASEPSPQPTDAGNNSESSSAEHADDEEGQAGSDGSVPGLPSTIEEASVLSSDWQDTYLRAMTRATDRPKSLLNRHTEAIQLIGGKANASEQEWMRAIFDLRKRNLEGQLSKADYDASIRELIDG